MLLRADLTKHCRVRAAHQCELKAKGVLCGLRFWCAQRTLRVILQFNSGSSLILRYVFIFSLLPYSLLQKHTLWKTLPGNYH